MKNFIFKIMKFLFPNLFLDSNDQHVKKDLKVEYKKKDFMTYNEKIFYNKLREIETCGDYIVCPQVNLASIIKKVSTSKYNTELFRNIDFVIFDKSYSTALLLIELNDSSHEKINRKDRDLKVKKIISDAGYQLMTFYTKYPNEKSYVINRVLEAISSKEKENI